MSMYEIAKFMVFMVYKFTVYIRKFTANYKNNVSQFDSLQEQHVTD